MEPFRAPFFICALGRSRTCSLLLRRESLYPVELRELSVIDYNLLTIQWQIKNPCQRIFTIDH